MNSRLRVLVLEERLVDAERMIGELHRLGYATDWDRVATESQYLAHLGPELDVILAGYAVGNLGAAEALGMLHEQRLDVAFIVVVEADDEDGAVDCLKAGADDYVVKDRLGRLGPAVRRATEAARWRRRLRSSRAIVQSSVRTAPDRQLFTEVSERAQLERSLVGFYRTSVGGEILDCNPAFARILGYDSREEIMSRRAADFYFHAEHRRRFLNGLQTHGTLWQSATRLRTKNGDSVWVLEDAVLRRQSGRHALDCRDIVEGVVIDISEQQQAEAELERRADHLRAINELAIDLSSARSTDECFQLLADKLKIISGAVAVNASAYDTTEQQLVVKYVSAEGWLVSRASRLLARRIVGWAVPVSDDTYARILDETVTTVSSLPETTFGMVPEPVAGRIQKALGIDRFVGLALADGDDLLGTAVLAFPPDRQPPTDETLKLFGRVAAAALRQRRAEEALTRVSQERRVLLDLVPVGITITDERGAIVDANRLSEELLGISVAEHKQRQYDGPEWDIIRPDGTPMPSDEYASVRALLDQRIVRNVESGIVKPDKNVTWISVSATPIPFEGYGVAIAYADITERKRAEEAVREKEKRLETLFEEALNPIMVVDESQRYVDANEAALAFLECTLDELRGKRVWAFTPPDQLEREVEAHKPFLSRRSHKVDYLVQGEVKTLLLNVVPITISGKTYLYGIGLDVTERQRVMEALQESEERFRRTFEDAASGMAQVSNQGVFIEVNQSFCDMLGYSRSELLGSRFQDVTHAEDQAKPRQVLDAQLAGERDHDHLEKRFVRRDGCVVWALLSTSMVRDPQGNPLYQISQIQNITNQKHAEQELQDRVADLELLSQIGSRIAADLDLDTVLTSAAELLHESFGYYQVFILEVDREAGELVVKTGSGGFTEYIAEGYRQGLDEGIIGWAASRGETVLVNDVEADPRYLNQFPDEVLSKSELSVPIRMGGDVIGVIDVQSKQLDAFWQDDVTVIETLADQIAVAIKNARLYDAERQARRQLRKLASHLQDARERERKQLSQELHDELGQALTAIGYELATIDDELPGQASPGTRKRMRDARSLVRQVDEQVSEMALDLRPSMLDDLGLLPALRWYVRHYATRRDVDLSLELIDLEARLPPALETALYRAVQEALTNVAKHAGATSVRVEVRQEASRIVAVIEDDGRGFNVTEKLHRADRPGLGLLGMEERISSLGGTLSIHSQPGQGTSLTIYLPTRTRHP